MDDWFKKEGQKSPSIDIETIKTSYVFYQRAFLCNRELLKGSFFWSISALNTFMSSIVGFISDSKQPLNMYVQGCMLRIQIGVLTPTPLKGE